MKAEEEIAQVAGTLAGADNARSRQVWLGLVEKKKLDFSKHLVTASPDRRWNIDLTALLGCWEKYCTPYPLQHNQAHRRQKSSGRAYRLRSVDDSSY